MLDKLKKKVQGKGKSEPRPYWHLDAKWITAMLLIVLFGATLFVYGFARISSEDTAKEIIATTFALSYSTEGSDDSGEIDELRAKFNADPGGEYGLFEDVFLVTVTEDEVANMTPREVRMVYFGKIADALYNGGIEELAELATTEEYKTAFLEAGPGVVGVLNKSVHTGLLTIALIMGAVSVVFFLLLIKFSAGFGRFASVGLVFIASSLPGSIVFSFVNTQTAGLDNTIGSLEEMDIFAYAQYMASNILPGVFDKFTSTFSIVLTLGVLLVITAIVGGIVKRARA